MFILLPHTPAHDRVLHAYINRTGTRDDNAGTTVVYAAPRVNKRKRYVSYAIATRAKRIGRRRRPPGLDEASYVRKKHNVRGGDPKSRVTEELKRYDSFFRLGFPKTRARTNEILGFRFHPQSGTNRKRTHPLGDIRLSVGKSRNRD